MQLSNRKQQKGFTLIELVVVIAILAILAAFALPRFAQLSEQAHDASIQGTAGAFAAGVALVKVQWVANGLTGAADDVIGFGNDNVDVSAEGWPTATGGNNTAEMTAGRCLQVWRGVLQSNAPSVSAAATDNPDFLATEVTGDCRFTYQLDGQTSFIEYDANTGEVSTVVN
ncbi:prepilin-type N-terminal cleavage/methylation domain-containing protein [Marinobacter sp.]|uniref:prepilin-type N-terminal cleavage/methylation domain-containing protein n=1 Tax=Marinobacter sp. TaxID=50741 RepID=UPI00385160F3